MAHQHKGVLGVGRARFPVDPNLHILPVLAIDIVRQTLFIRARVAPVTIGIGLAVADLALNLADVNGVIPNGAVLKVLMAILAANLGIEMITVLDTLWCGSVHFCRSVARRAMHVGLDGMDITLPTLTQVFVTDPAAVTRRALVEQIGFSIELVAINKAAAHVFGPANVATAAACMAIPAMALASHIDCFPLLRITALLKHAGKWRQGGVERIGCCGDDLLMTIPTGIFRSSDGRLWSDADVG